MPRSGAGRARIRDAARRSPRSARALRLLRRLGIGCVLWTLTGSLLAAGAPSKSPPKAQYNRDIRPILSDNCFLCHGPDKNTRKGKLRLDLREEALARKAIVPGRPGESSLVARILTPDPEDVMPPPDSHRRLAPGQKALLQRWVAEGAEYQPHWAYVKPVRSEPPAVRAASRVRNPIDAFILQNLEAHGRRFAPEAARGPMLRRLSLDLIGLPPTPEELAVFLADREPFAYEKQVDRLLASPHFGERMAVPWLDTVRFADTVGYHGDQNQRIFPYRDYVIASFNRNKPFSEFTIEQLAGDLLSGPSTGSGQAPSTGSRQGPTVEQRVATGFNRLNMMTREGGAQPREYLAKYTADRVRTVAATWLGSTMGCAECHDHKFDPFTMRDFYSMGAFFADVRQWGVYADYKYTPNPDLRGWSNEHPFPPELEVESEYLQRRLERFRQTLREHLAATYIRLAPSPAFAAWVQASREFAAGSFDRLRTGSAGWQTLEVLLPEPAPPAPLAAPAGSPGSSGPASTAVVSPAARSTGSGQAPSIAPGHAPAATNEPPHAKVSTNPPAPPLSAEPGGAVRVAFGGKKEEEKLEVRLAPGRVAALRLERLSGEPDEKLGPGDQARGLRLSATLKRNGKGKESKVSFYRADADRKEPRYGNGEELLGILAGWKPSSEHAGEPQTAVWLPEPPIDARAGDVLVVTLKSAGPLTVRFASSPFAAEAPLDAGVSDAFRDALAAGPDARTDAQRLTLAERYLLSTQAEADEDAFDRFKELEEDILECRGGRAHTLITAAWKPGPTRVLPRGNWQNESGELVQAAPPRFLAPEASKPGQPWTRLDLARWLVSRDNPLTARVLVNRFWKQFFGAGLSLNVDDLGAQGDWPVHAALLDWLAVEFMEPSVAAERAQARPAPDPVPWDIKHLVRLIVTSATYRQQAGLRADLNELDPQNRWLGTQNPRRLEAEFVRDNALFVAGLLNLELGGPSVRPYQPAGYYEALQFPDRNYVMQTDERQYRRGIYMHWQRTFLHPMLANFDAPSREECTATRNVSNTPQQALTLLNGPSFVEAARVLAARVLQSAGPSERSRFEHVYGLALGRKPKSQELTSLGRFLAGQRAHYRAEPGEAEQLLQVGMTPVPAGLDQTELAAWTEVCRVLLNTHESITRY